MNVCKDCRYFHRKNDTDQNGLCTRNPPVMNYIPVQKRKMNKAGILVVDPVPEIKIVTQYPQVGETLVSCGEFKPKESGEEML